MLKTQQKPLATLIIKAIKVLRIKTGFILPTFLLKISLKLQQCPFGSNLKACGKVYVRPNFKSSIKLGNNVRFLARYLTNSAGMPGSIMLECINNGKIEIGDNSGITSSVISSRTSVKIGDNVNIGANVRIYDHDFHSLNYLTRRPFGDDANHIKSSPVVIEDDVFIGTASIILKGVNIGARSIVAAGSVVAIKSIPPDSLVGGNPARILKNNIN